MIKSLLYCLATLVVACGGNPSGNVRLKDGIGISLDSLERFVAGQRRTREQPYDSACVRGLATPVLTEEAPFVQSDYSFVRPAPNRSYETCHYNDCTVLEISQWGCEYFTFSFGWCYNGLPENTNDSLLVERSLNDMKEVARWCGVFRQTILVGVDTLGFYLRKDGLDSVKNKLLDFYSQNYDFRYTVSVDSIVRFSDAGMVRITFSEGPL